MDEFRCRTPAGFRDDKKGNKGKETGRAGGMNTGDPAKKPVNREKRAKKLPFRSRAGKPPILGSFSYHPRPDPRCGTSLF